MNDLDRKIELEALVTEREALVANTHFMSGNSATHKLKALSARMRALLEPVVTTADGKVQRCGSLEAPPGHEPRVQPDRTCKVRWNGSVWVVGDRGLAYSELANALAYCRLDNLRVTNDPREVALKYDGWWYLFEPATGYCSPPLGSASAAIGCANLRGWRILRDEPAPADSTAMGDQKPERSVDRQCSTCAHQKVLGTESPCSACFNTDEFPCWEPKHDTHGPDEQRGIYRKYRVERLDDPTGKHSDCEYFVLDWKHDPYTIPAVRAYAAACVGQYPELAKELLERAEAIAPSDTCDHDVDRPCGCEEAVELREKLRVQHQEYLSATAELGVKLIDAETLLATFRAKIDRLQQELSQSVRIYPDATGLPLDGYVHRDAVAQMMATARDTLPDWVLPLTQAVCDYRTVQSRSGAENTELRLFKAWDALTDAQRAECTRKP